MLTGLITLGSVAVASTAVWGGIGLLDSLHITEAELLLYDLKAHTFAANQFSSLEEKLTKIELVSKCRFLKTEINALSDAIYVRIRDGADPDHIHDLEDDLDELQADYNALACQLMLA